MKKAYSVETTITKSHDGSNLQVPTYIIEFTSKDESKTDEAGHVLKALFGVLEIKLVIDPAGNQIYLEAFLFEHL
jgi:hypothetical protein